MRIAFVAWRQLYGFDPSIVPSQMIPKTDSKWVRLKGGKGGSLGVLSGRMTHVKCERVLDKGNDRYFKLKGLKSGSEWLIGHSASKKETASLFVTVRLRKTVAVGLRLWRSRRGLDEVSKAIDKVNALYLPQANIRFARSAGASRIGRKEARALRKKIGRKVEYDSDSKDYGELKAFLKHMQKTAAVTLFFVPDLDNTSKGGDTQGTMRTLKHGSTKKKVIFIEDEIATPLENTAAHELGHFLGLSHEPSSPNNIMYSSGSCSAAGGLATCPRSTGNRKNINAVQVSKMHG